MSAPLGVRLGVAAIAACSATLALYAVIRAAERLLFPEADPAVVFYSEHAGFFWRAWTAAYAGGAFGFVAFLLARRDAPRAATLARGALVASIALIALQAALVP